MAKYRYIPFKTLNEMTVDEYNTLPPRSNWMPEFKLGTSSILADGNPRILLSHFVLGIVHAVKVYGQYGEVSKRYDTACQVINYGLGVNKFVVPHRKLGGQRLRVAQKDMLQDWIESLCDNYGGDDSDRHYQGDGVASSVIVLDGTNSGVPAHAFTDGAEKTADELYNFMLSEVKAQKELGLHRVSNVDRTKQRLESALLSNINRVTSGKYLLILHALSCCFILC